MSEFQDDEGWSPEKEKPAADRFMDQFSKYFEGVGQVARQLPTPCGVHSYELGERFGLPFLFCRACGDVRYVPLPPDVEIVTDVPETGAEVTAP